MKTLRENTKAVGDSAYWGDRGNWFIVAAVHRDSDALDRSNFSVSEAMLKDNPASAEWSGEFQPYAIERFNHWAVGWIDYLLIDPECKPLVELGESIQARIENYPVLDESHFSEIESQEANEIWQNCYNPRERVKYIRDNRSQFHFHDYRDLIGCVRGNYFAGYASELIH